MQLLSTSSDCQRHLSFVSWFTVAVRPVYSVRNLRFSVAASSAIHINLNIHDSTCGKLLRPTERNDNWLSASENKETNSSDRSEQQKKSNDETTVARALQSTVVSTYFKWKMNTHWSVKLKINWLIRVPPEGLDQQNRLILLNAFRLIDLRSARYLRLEKQRISYSAHVVQLFTCLHLCFQIIAACHTIVICCQVHQLRAPNRLWSVD